MTSYQALQIEDPEGSVMVVTRVDDTAYTIGITYTAPGTPFRMFEDDRARLRAFLDPLDG